MKKLIIIGSLGLIAFLGFLSIINQKDSPKESFFDQLDTADIVRLTIESDFTTLIDNRNKDLKQAALLSGALKPGVFRAYPIEISVRGNTRKNLCSFPPLRLHFEKELLEKEGLADFNKYKLVTHCMDNTELVLKEYLG